MRITVTLDPDVEALVRETMQEHGLSFEQALNQAIRVALGRRRGTSVQPFRQRQFSLGRARIDLTKALALAGELDDLQALKRQGPP